MIAHCQDEFPVEPGVSDSMDEESEDHLEKNDSESSKLFSSSNQPGCELDEGSEDFRKTYAARINSCTQGKASLGPKPAQKP